jgi:hypothetical protein
MFDHEKERWVKARHDVTQFYLRKGVKRTTNRQDLPRGDMTISDDPNPSANNSSKDDDVEAKHDTIFDEVVAACRAKHLGMSCLFKRIGTMR